MNIHGLDSILKPRRIAITGVSINPNSVGGRVLRNLVSGACRGVLYPINATQEAVLGIPCFPDIASLPGRPDLVIICSAADEVADSLIQAGEAGVGGVIIMSAGFKEVGEAGVAAESRLKEIKSRYPGMRVLGPNCLGVISPELDLNASFADGMPKKGNVAFISQSGALCTSVLDWAREGGIGFSGFVSVGNALDVGFADLIDYFGEDEATEAIVLYMESVTDAARFMSAARAYARVKPIIVYKAGRFPDSAAVAASHTGAMVSEDAVYDAAFERAGMVRVFNIGEIFDCVELVGRRKLPAGPRLGVVTNAGGPGVIAADKLMETEGRLAELSPESMEKLNACLPPFWSRANPVDILGDAKSKRFEKAASIVLQDKGVDALLVILTPQGMTRPDRVAKAIAKVAASTKKPVLAAWMGGETVREGIRLLAEAGVATYQTPEQAVQAFMTLVAYARNLESLYQTPRDIRLDLADGREDAKTLLADLAEDRPVVLSESLAKELLECYGIPTTLPVPAADPKTAAAAAEEMGYPVALKLDSPDITHKSDVGGVVLDLKDAASVEAAFGRIMESARAAYPDARITGVAVQRMVETGTGVEMILGFKRDPVFGTLIMAGAGGVAVEIADDSALGFPPLNHRLVMRMLESLRMKPLLTGYRGIPPVDIEALVQVIMRLSYMAGYHPEITELDINPLLCKPGEIVALDARAVLDPSAVPEKPFEHLALRPYPEEYVERQVMEDGTRLLLRPIRPEDEPMWLELLGACSKESIYSRFRFFYNWETHDAAVRYCYIDYQREMALVAELEQDGRRKLAGVGRLVSNLDLDTVEYAVLVGDPWQNMGLGKVLTETCERIAARWGAKRIEALTSKDNVRMVKLFQGRNWEEKPIEDGLLEVWKDL